MACRRGQGVPLLRGCSRSWAGYLRQQREHKCVRGATPSERGRKRRLAALSVSDRRADPLNEYWGPTVAFVMANATLLGDYATVADYLDYYEKYGELAKKAEIEMEGDDKASATFEIEEKAAAARASACGDRVSLASAATASASLPGPAPSS